MCLIDFVLKKAVPVPKLENYDSYLFIGPHPDDIEVGCGGTVAKLVEAGKKVTFLIATDGRAGSANPDDNPDDIVKIRIAETYASAKSLGVTDIVMLPFRDGGFYTVEELRTEFMKVIAKVKPDVILAPDHTLRNECHPDHLKTGEAATHAFMSCPFIHIMRECGIDDIAQTKVIAYYYTAKPNYFVKLNARLHKRKLAALNNFKSQFPIENDVDGEWRGMKLYFRVHALKCGIKKLSAYGDGFRVLGTVHAHCAPEAENI